MYRSLLQKYNLQRIPPVNLPADLIASKPTQDVAVSLRETLHKVLQLPSVASKRYLTNKVFLAIL